MTRPDEPQALEACDLHPSLGAELRWLWQDVRAAHPLLWKAVQLSACAALGTALPDIIDFLRWLI